MAKVNNSFEAMARAAAARLDQARAAGEQLELLPLPGEVDQGEAGKVGRSKGKATNQFREWLAANGFRMPEWALAQMAGLASDDPPLIAAMREAELVLAWMYADAKDKDGNPAVPTPRDRLAMFTAAYTIKLRANEAMLPYGLSKATPDAIMQQTVQVVMPGASPDRAATARDVTPRAARIGTRMMPADVAARMLENQQVEDSASGGSDDEARTE